MTQSTYDELTKIFFQFVLPALILAIPSAYFSWRSYQSANKAQTLMLPIESEKVKAEAIKIKIDANKTEVETLTLIIGQLREHIISLEEEIKVLAEEVAKLRAALADCLSSKSNNDE